MNAALPTMSSTPTIDELRQQVGAHPPRLAERARSPPRGAATARGARRPAAASAPSPENWPTHTLNRPIIVPPRSAHPMPDGRSSSTCPGARVTSTTASSATTIPTTTIRSGMPSRQEPDDDRDDRREDAGRRRDDAHPADGEAAIERGDADDAGDAGRDRPAEVGALRERLAAARGRWPARATSPTSCVPSTTPSSGARRASVPPPKSPAPQASAEMSPSRMTDEPAARGRQAGATTSGSTWSSTAVGPSSTTTESASAS